MNIKNVYFCVVLIFRNNLNDVYILTVLAFNSAEVLVHVYLNSRRHPLTLTSMCYFWFELFILIS